MRLRERIRCCSLKTKIIAITILIAIIPLSILGISAYQINNSGLMDQKISDTQTNLRSISQSINSVVNTRQISALRFCSTTDVAQLVVGTNPEDEAYQESLYSLQRFFNEYMNTKGIHSIILYGINESFYASNPGKIAQQAYEEQFLNAQDTSTSEPWWGKLAYDGDDYYLPFNIPIRYPASQNLIGILTINFLETEFQTTYNYFASEDNQLLLAAEDGSILSSTDTSLILKSVYEVYGSPEGGQDFKTADYFFSVVDGERKLVSCLNNATNDMYIVCISDLKSMETAQQQLLLTLTLVIASSIFIVVFLAVFLSRNITKPVNTLVSIIKSLDTDTPVVPSPFKYQDEIGIIGEALSEMTVKLKDSSRQLLEEQKAKRETELRTLLMQINPHFLGNTLASAIWLIQMDKKEEAIELITALSQMFKLSLYRGQEEITIDNELKYLENYLNVHKIRYGNEFDYAIHCEDNLRECTIIKLLTQPLVENAIYHGIDFAEGEKGQIVIDISGVDEMILIRIKNQPSNITAETITRINECLNCHRPDSGFGIGLMNVNERIRLTYGAEYGMHFSLEKEWTIVTIRIPLRKDKSIKDGDNL